MAAGGSARGALGLQWFRERAGPPRPHPGFAKSGEADSLQSPEGENLFRACETAGHHHHLICRRCGNTVEIEARAVEQWARDVAAENGFSEAEHVVDIFGVCAECVAKAA